MKTQTDKQTGIFDQRFLTIMLIVLAVAVFLITYVSIKESRSDSFKLLVMQGQAFIESLSSAAENAITSEQFYDNLVHKRYNEISIELEQKELLKISEQELYQIAVNHNLYAAFTYNIDSTLIAGSIARGSFVQLPDYVVEEVKNLIANPEDNYLLLLDEAETHDEIIHYYIKLSNKLDRVIVLAADALYYVEALKQTQIGYLARLMAQEKGISYIIYQSTEGIIFSSRKTAEILSIESDEFLVNALESDSVMHRKYKMDDEDILELVRPFSTADFPYGLLRVGLSLNAYNVISRGYDIQMIIFSAALFLLVLVLMVYLNSRRKRKEITAQYHQIKSISDKIFDEMETGVAAVDYRGEITLANNAFEKIFGLKPLVNKKWDSVVSDESITFSVFNQSAESIMECEIDFIIQGEIKSLLVVLSKMKDVNETTSGMVAVVYDMTKMKELEKKSARKERLSEMGNLAAGVAHEIRNPLNTISIASQRLAAEFQPNENSEEYLSFTKQIRDETKRLNVIITRFLALARGEEQKNQTVDLNEIILKFVSFVKAEADERNIEIEIDLNESIKVDADIDKLKQVLSNLFNNAKEALSGQSGKIKISTQNVNRNSILIFEDSGPGIPSEIRDKIFTPYYTTKEAGTGLGLPTIHRIISDMGREIKVEESELGGAKFMIMF